MVAAPTITSVAPGNIKAGTATTCTVTGTGFSTSAVPTVTTDSGVTVGTPVGVGGTSFTVQLTASAGNLGRLLLSVKQRHAISNVVLTSNVVTVTVESGHSIQVGDSIVVAAVTQTAINGTYTVTAVGATTISYALTHANIGTGADTGYVTGPALLTPISVVAAAGAPTADGYGYANSLAVAASGSRAIDSAMETTHGVLNPRNGTVHASATSNQQSDQQWQDAGAGATPAYPAARTNPVIALNQRVQEADLIGVGLGDSGASHSESFPITNKVLTSNVATITTAQAHGFAVGEVVVVASMADTNFNGTFTITAVTSTTISYAKTHADIGTAAVTAGTVSKAIADRPRRLHAPSV